MPLQRFQSLLTAPILLTRHSLRAAAGFLPDGSDVDAHARTPEHLVEEGLDLAEGGLDLAEEVVTEGIDLIEDALGTHRRVWEHEGHAEIEVRALNQPESQDLRRRLKQALEQLDAVEWAQVNALTNRVAVAFDGDRSPVGAVVGVIEGLEALHGVRGRVFDERRGSPRWETDDRADHPADVEPLHRAIAALVGDTVGLGASIAGRLARLPRVPIEVASLVSLVDHHPWVREQIESRVGKRPLDFALPLLGAAASGIAQGPTGITVDMAYRASLIGELRARGQVWDRRQAEFYAAESEGVLDPPELDPRPMPLPQGPVEAWSSRISLSSLAGFGVALSTTRDLRRAADVFLAGIPKAARLGREGFATHLGRVLADRGVVPLDASALRRLDRVDTVVLDSATMLSDEVDITAAIPLGNLDAATAEACANELLDTRDAGAHRHRDGWSLQPFAELAGDIAVPRGGKTRAREMRADGSRPLALSYGGRVEAVVAATPTLDPGAYILVEAVRRAGHRLVVAGRHGQVDRRVDADDTIPAGRAMGAAIRAMQAEGRVVAAVVRHGTTGLAAADVGINLQQRTGRPSWGGDLLCGPELLDAVFLIDATVVAAQVSRRSAEFAVAGSSLGVLVAVTGPREAAGRRCLAMVNAAAAASLASGTWSSMALGRRPRPLLADATPWHALEAPAALERLDTRETGLTAGEARERRRADRAEASDPSALEPFLAELANPLNPVLGVGAGLSATVGSMVDAAMVGGLIGVNTLVGGMQRLRTDRAVGQLMHSTANEAQVLRDGREVVVTEDALVKGDVVLLRAGDAVPADCRVLTAEGLETDESSLTGESLPVSKHPEPCAEESIADRRCMLYQDTTIAAGAATALVVAVGAETEIGRSLAEVGDHLPSGGVEARLEDLTRKIVPGAIVAALGVAGAGFLRNWPMRDIVGTGVSLAVASVPEGLPFLATAAQTAAARRLSERNALVRDPRAIEALGRVDVLCFDKTGTLTEGVLALRLLSDGEEECSLGDITTTGCEVLAAALRATPVDAGENGSTDATDEAVRQAAEVAGVEPCGGIGAWEHITTLPFEPSRGLHAALGEEARGHRLSVKGAPETVLPRCSAWRSGGQRQAFDEGDAGRLMRQVESLAGRGYRVLAVGERLASDRTEVDDARVSDLEFCGFIALTDPVRATAAEAVAGVRSAGVEPVMVTGDHPGTAEAIATDLGMLEGRRVVTGADLESMDDTKLDALVGEVGAFARVSPAQKVRIVSALQRVGRKVAMTGDGANDAPSIRLADVGVALGSRGTPAARDAADLIVIDDRIETIIDAIAEGRALWGSVRDALGILVGGNIGEIAFTMVSSLLSRRAPMNARQFLLVNLVTDLAPAMAVAVRPPADLTPERLLREGPDVSLGAALNREITIRATATSAGATAAWLAARMTGTRRRASTVALVSLVGTQLGQTLLAGGRRSPLVLVTSVGSAAALVALVQTPGVSQFFGCRPMGPLGWAQANTAAVLATAGSAFATRALGPVEVTEEPEVAEVVLEA